MRRSFDYRAVGCARSSTLYPQLSRMPILKSLILELHTAGHALHPVIRRGLSDGPREHNRDLLLGFDRLREGVRDQDAWGFLDRTVLRLCFSSFNRA